MINFFYGINTIKNLILYKKKYINKIFLCLNKKNIKLLNLKKIIINEKISFQILNKYIFKKKFKKFNFIHQGIIALVKNKLFNNNNEKKLLYIIKNKKLNNLLILDNINSPYNLGSCIRTAVAANIDCIIVSKNNSVSIENNIVHKISNGAIYKILIFEVLSIYKIIIFLKLYNFKIIGTCINSKKNLYDINFLNYKNYALILGSEKNGIKLSIKKKCDILLNIPIFKINSLNVSVAYGIIIFEILRQIKKK